MCKEKLLICTPKTAGPRGKEERSQEESNSMILLRGKINYCNYRLLSTSSSNSLFDSRKTIVDMLSFKSTAFFDGRGGSNIGGRVALSISDVRTLCHWVESAKLVLGGGGRVVPGLSQIPGGASSCSGISSDRCLELFG